MPIATKRVSGLGHLPHRTKWELDNP